MITNKQIRLLKLIERNEEIRAKDGRRIYNTYDGFYNAVYNLESMGLISSYNDFLFGCRIWRLTKKGYRFIS